MQWLTIEVFDADIPAGAWERAHHDALVEAAVTLGCVYWDWHQHRWGVVVEFAFLEESPRDAFRDATAVRAAIDAAPDPVSGVLVYPHRGGGSGSRVPRVPRPAAGAGAVELPEPAEPAAPTSAIGTRVSPLSVAG